MSINIKPSQGLNGRIRLPASKSYSIRAFFIAALGGKSRILFPSHCEDARVALNIAKALGANVIKTPQGYHIETKTLSMYSGQRLCHGEERFLDQPVAEATQPSHRSKTEINVGESGTSLRFLLPLLTFLPAPVRVTGEGTLVGRPNTHLCESLRKAGLDIRGKGVKESVPIVYKGGLITRKTMRIDGSLSSQYVSALLIACPCLPHETRIEVTGKMVSVDYISMTLQLLRKAGIEIQSKGLKKFVIKGNQHVKGLSHVTIPSDYGLAAFPLALGALLPSQIILEGFFNDRFIQADGHILSLLKRMGVKVKKAKNRLTMRGPFALKGGVFSLKDCPDLVPIMAVLAMFAKGTTTLTGIAHARVKESDRIGDLKAELEKVGARFLVTQETLTIYPQKTYTTGVRLDSHRDHRLAMAFTVLGAKIGCVVNDLTCTHKSYPSFVKDMKSLGLKMR